MSRWVIRRYDGEDYRIETIPKIYPDDDEVADGRRFLNFQQVVAKIMNDNAKIPVQCSFCGKGHKQVAKLIAGPSVFICDKCVGLCQIYLDRPDQLGKLVVDEKSEPVLKHGEPTFRPLTREEENRIRERYDFGSDVSAGGPD